MRRTLATLAVLAALLGTAACGEDEKPDKDELSARELQAQNALTRGMQQQETTDNGKRQADCTAEELVRRVGVDRLVSAGLLTEELTMPTKPVASLDKDVAEGTADAIVACWNPKGQAEDVKPYYPKATDAQLKAYEKCLADIPESVIKDAIVQSSLKDGDKVKAAAFGEAVSACRKPLG